MSTFRAVLCQSTIAIAALALAVVGISNSTAAPIRMPHDTSPVCTMRIGDYDYELPAWWDSIAVTGKEEIHELKLPTGLKDEQGLREWIEQMKESTAMEKERTPREHLKIRAMAWQHRKDLPLFLVSWHMEAQEYLRAARICVDLYKLAESHGDKKDRDQCYLAHNAGRCFFYVREYESAAMWHRRAAAYRGHKDPSISQQDVELSADMIETCDRSAAIMRARRN